MGNLTGAALWLSVILLIACLAITVWVWMETMRKKYRSAAVNAALCEFLTKTGVSREILLPVVNGEVVAPVDSAKKKGKQMKYVLSKDSVYNARYPSQGILAKLGTIVPKAIWIEGNAEPITNRTNIPIISSELLLARDDEKFSGLAVEASSQLRDIEDKLSSFVDPVKLFIVLGCAIAVSGAAVYLTYLLRQDFAILQEAVKAGLGI